MEKKKTKDIKVLIEELNQIKKQLSEDFMFNGDGGMMQDPREMEGEQAPNAMGGNQQMGDPTMPQKPQQMGQGDSEEEIAMYAQEIIQHEPIVGKIREISIEGLKKYADHPTSELYKYFKSVFLDSDKLLTNTGGK